MKNNPLRLICLTLVFAFSVSVVSFAGWEQDGSSWKYQNEDGSYKQKGWYEDENGKWFYFRDGAMVTGWIYTSDGKYYYQLPSGESANGWLQIEGNWYYFDTDNTMWIGTMTVDSITYHFGNNGICSNPDATPTATSPDAPGEGWMEIGVIHSEDLLRGLANGTIVYHNGKYWTNITSEKVVSIIDVSDGYVETFTRLTPELSLELDAQ